jgi:HlyD family secretion protein
MTTSLDRRSRRSAAATPLLAMAMMVSVTACRQPPPSDRVRVSGQVEATDIHVAAQVGGRVLELTVTEGSRVAAGTVVARLDTADATLALDRARADRAQVEAQRRLLRAGPRIEDVRQAEAQVMAARTETAAADADVAAAQVDVDRFEALVASRSGSRKQRDDAVSRRDVARARARAVEERVRVAEETLARVKAGARREEVAAADARVTAADVQIKILEKAIADAVVTAPVSGIVSDLMVDVGELVAPRAPLVVITDLDRAWANVYVDEPVVPRLRIGQPATLFTDSGGPGIAGRVRVISTRAEFTPRNVQTAQDRSQLVYRLEVSVDNTSGVLKSGMPVEAELVFQPLQDPQP